MRNATTETKRPADPDDRVRTTVSIPEDVWLRAKGASAKRRCSMGNLVTEGLMAILPGIEGKMAS